MINNDFIKCNKLGVNAKFYQTLNVPKEAFVVVIYGAFCSDLTHGHINGAPNETRTHSRRFASHACELLVIY